LITPCVSSSAIKVFDFDSARLSPPGPELSSVVLSSSQTGSLPDRFVLCSSAKQGKIDGKSPYLLRGQDCLPWLAFSLYPGDDGHYMWIDVSKGKFWAKLHSIEKPWTNVWMHICADVDTVTGTLRVSLNGRPALNATTKYLKENKPESLKGKLELGVTRKPDGTKQYFGSVTNINIFQYDSSKLIEDLARNPCGNVGDYMPWADAEFAWEGKRLDEYQLKREEFCEVSSESNILLLLTEMSWIEAQHSCRILGNGSISENKNEEQIKRKITWMKDSKSTCTVLWTPITDKYEEGVFINTVDGTIEKFLPWKEGQPNGGASENFIQLEVRTELYIGRYFDRAGKNPACVTCDVKMTTIFRLRGQCETSYLGESTNHQC
jgi:hypothetical protein